MRLSNGLTMKSVAPSLNASFKMFFCPGADDDDLRVRVERDDFAEGIDAVVFGHDEIDGHGQGPEFGVAFDGLLAVAGFADDFPAGPRAASLIFS